MWRDGHWEEGKELGETDSPVGVPFEVWILFLPAVHHSKRGERNLFFAGMKGRIRQEKSRSISSSLCFPIQFSATKKGGGSFCKTVCQLLPEMMNPLSFAGGLFVDSHLSCQTAQRPAEVHIPQPRIFITLLEKRNWDQRLAETQVFSDVPHRWLQLFWGWQRGISGGLLTRPPVLTHPKSFCEL